MKTAEAFLEAMDRKAKMFAPSARATFEANRELCSWLLNPLARWAEAAYGDTVFDEAARGYAEYCVGVAKAKAIYERAGRYTPEHMPEIMSGVYEDEGYMVPYMWAAILIYPFWPSMISHIAMLRDEFVRRLPTNATVRELAAGHGVLSLLAAEERPDLQIEGSDISPPAVAVANRLLAVSGHIDRVRFEVKDALKVDTGGSGNDTRESFRQCSPNTCRIRSHFLRRWPEESLRMVWCSSAPRSNRRSGTTFLNTTGKASRCRWPRLPGCECRGWFPMRCDS